MPTIEDFKASNTPYQERLKVQALMSKIKSQYGLDNTSYATLKTLKANWEALYETELAAATIDNIPSSIATEITALQSTYSTYST